MKIPNADRAVVDIAKLRDYCLNKQHPRGKHKARLFETMLRIKDLDAEELQSALLEIIKTHSVWKAGEINKVNATLLTLQ